MAPLNTLIVRDRDGWYKEIVLERSLMYIGSATENDVVLDAARGGGVQSRHVQLITSKAEGQPYQALNLGDAPLQLSNRGFASRAAVALRDGDILELGEFTLRFRFEAAPAAKSAGPAEARPAKAESRKAERAAPAPAPAPEPVAAQPVQTAPPAPVAAAPVAGPPPTVSPIAPAETPPAVPAAPLPPAGGPDRTSPVIGIELAFAEYALSADVPLEGTVTVRNLGTQPGVQFHLELDGLPTECCTLGPGPILFPNGERDVFVRLTHPRSSGIPAGPRRITVQASAPDAYPGEAASTSQTIEILPFHGHTMKVAARR